MEHVGGRGALVHEHDDEVRALGDEIRGFGVHRLHDPVNLDVGDPGGAHERRKLLRHCTDEADLNVAELLDPGGGNGRLPGGAHLQVRRDVLPLGAALRVGFSVVVRHHPVDEVVVALVELVVADRRDFEARSVEGIDRRLVVLNERLERRRADQVARSRENGVRVRGAKSVHGPCELRGTGLRTFIENAAVEVVRRDDLDLGVHRVRGRCRDRAGGEREDGRCGADCEASASDGCGVVVV